MSGLAVKMGKTSRVGGLGHIARTLELYDSIV